jgi:oligopeptide transport system ATP-binding protein
MNESILEVKNLRVWYPMKSAGAVEFVKAVDEVSFSMESGKTLGLVGESGSGKSTIGRAIVRLAPLRAGEIRFRGKSITGLSDSGFSRVRKKIQMIFQDPYYTLNPRMTIGVMLAEPIKIHFPGTSAKEIQDQSVDYLEQVGLDADAMQRYPHQFSGGQRQRIGIARAMTVKPEILICDEVVSALDVSVQAQIVNLLQDLQQTNGFSYLFIGHDLAVIEHISDRVMVMQNGKIVESGTPEAIYSHPEQEYTRRLLDAVPKLPSLSA